MLITRLSRCKPSRHIVGLFALLLATSPLSVYANEVDDWAAPIQQADLHKAAGRYEEALTIYKEFANKENGLAQFNVALFYQLGLSTKTDKAEACHWFHRAAINNMPGAMQQVGNCFAHGLGGQIDINQAIHWYTKAYQQGVHATYCQIGLLYLKGEGVQKDTGKAVDMCLKGAELGAFNAQVVMAKWYFYGTHVKQDYQKAFFWLQYAANKKSPESAFLMALYYDQGIGMEIDLKQALRWYEISASQAYEAAYLPTAALYWQAFLDHQKESLLAKSYLWAQAHCLSSHAVSQDSLRLKNKIEDVMPNTWQDALDEKVVAHLNKFQKHQHNNNC
ncbi:tetratricopeptide repeat protein [Agaribacter flavus]|uniref:Tetratricopeptide repeat protein n=1 Tax=Agaribacter flavus TaxID=1902781 RepID=A0ABV7FNE2_9ALTE